MSDGKVSGLEHSDGVGRTSDVQTEGVVVVLNMAMTTVTHLSSNTSEFLGRPPQAFLGQGVKELFSAELVHALRNNAAAMVQTRRRKLIGRFEVCGRLCVVALHVAAHLPIVELEPAQERSAQPPSPMARVRAMMDKVQRRVELPDIINAALKALRVVTACEHITAYRFWPGGDSEVVAEVCRPGSESLLGLRLPDALISPQALALLLHTSLRMVFDASAEPASLLAFDEDAAEVDLSMSYLMGVEREHREALQKMGVHGMLSLPIVVNGELWGLFTSHNEAFPLRIDPDARIACVFFSQIFSLILERYEEQRLHAIRDRLIHARDILSALDFSRPEAYLETIRGELKADVAFDGLAMKMPRGWVGVGATMPAATMDALVQRAAEEERGVSFVEDLQPAAHDVAGALVGHVVDVPSLAFVLMRASQETTAGGGARCAPWTREDIWLIGELCALLRTSLTLNGGMTRRQQVDAEINHRVRNHFELMRSLIRQTRNTTSTLDTYAEALEGRVLVLASAHDLSMGYGTMGIPLQRLLESEFSAIRYNRGQVSIRGPLIRFKPELGASVALLIHELASNSCRHGALSDPRGKLSISWFRRGGTLRLEWNETLQAAAKIGESGFGLSYIERAVAFDLDGESEVVASGVSFIVRIRAPESCLIELGGASTVGIEPVGADEEDLDELTLDEMCILVVEDNMLLAMDTCDLLEGLGAAYAESTPSLEQAFSFIMDEEYDLALLDIKIGSADSFDLARRLVEEGTPFIFVTGYDADYILPDDLQDAVITRKPISLESLKRAIGAKMNHI